MTQTSVGNGEVGDLVVQIAPPMRILFRKTSALAAAAAVFLSACTGSEPKHKPSPVPLTATLGRGELKAVSATDAPEANQRASEELPKVMSTLNSFYTIAFVDPKKWNGGTHPALTGLLTAEAQPSLSANLGGMALGDIAPKVKSFKVDKQHATKISFFIENDLTAPVVVATVAFEGVATTKAGAKGPVRVSHNGTFWLLREADVYKISAYSGELKADTVPPRTKRSAFGL